MADKVYVKDIGSQIVLETGEDISSGSEFKLLAKNPTSGKVLYLSAAIGGTTQIVHTKNAKTFNVAGTWKLQGRVRIGGDVYYSEICYLAVERTLA